MTAIDSTTWPAKYPGERITVEFDFSRDLSPGDSVSSVQITLTTVLGTDPSPAALLFGPTQLHGARAYQMLDGGLAGCSYKVVAAATTQNNNVILLARVLPVVSL